MDQISFALFVIQKALLILTPSLSQIMILHLLMILIIRIRLRIIARSLNQVDQFPVIFLESQKYYLVFMSASQRTRPIKSLLQQGTFCLKRRSLTGLIPMQKTGINKMSLCEVHIKWAG